MKNRFTILLLLMVMAQLRAYSSINCAVSESYTVSPAPGAGNEYAPGQVVTFCYTVSGYNQTGSNSNWFHGLTINFGPGWDSTSLSVISYPTSATQPSTAPDQPSIWGYFPNGVTSAADTVHYGAGFYFETGAGEANNTDIYNGNPGDNYGDHCDSGTCSWTFCFSIQVSTTAAPGTSLALSVLPTGDGESGSWALGVGKCADPLYPLTNGTTVGGNLLIVHTSETNAACFGLCNGTATIAAFNGTKPYTYKWNTSPAQTTAGISNLCAGTYICTVTDSVGSTATASANISQPMPLALVSDSLVPPTCHGICNGAVITKITGGTTPYTYTWIGGAAPNSAVDYSLCAGIARLSVTDSNHCVFTDSFFLTQPAVSAVNLISQTNITCKGEATGAISVAYSGGAGGTISYSWSNNETTSADTGLVAGTYKVYATDSVGCSASATYNITEPATGISVQSPAITPVSCFGGNNGAIDANATGGTGSLSYAWTEVSDSAHYTGQDITGLSADTYRLTVTDGGSCSASASYQLSSPPAIVIDSFVAHNIPCFGETSGSAAIYAHGGTVSLHYQWSISSADTLATVTDLASGPLSVTVTDANHCQLTDTGSITQPAAALTITLISKTDILCFGINNGSVNVSASGGTPNYIYNWSNRSHAAVDSALASGTYMLTVTDANLCSATQSYIISPAVAFSTNPVVDSILCFGSANGSINSNPAGGASPYKFQWSNGDSTQIINGLAPGIYSSTVSDNNGCSSTFTDSITQPAQLNISVTPSPVKCAGQKNGSVAVALTGGVSPYSYSASKDSSNFVYGSNSTIGGLDTGTYVLFFSDANGCTQERSTYIQNALPDSFTTSADSTSCFGKEYTDGSALAIAISVANGPYQYAIDNGIEQDTGYFSNLPAGPHTIISTSVNRCVDTLPIIVGQPAQLQVSIEPDSINLTLGSSKAVITTCLNASNPVFSWSPGVGLSCTDCPNPVASPYVSNDYTLTVSEQKPGNSCYATATLHVVVTSYTPVFIPNAFSPNGDGNNDVFKIYGENISTVSIKIFNRWGELVFETGNALAGWDGTYKGQLQEANVYLYEATITFLDNTRVEKNGSFTLVR